jgi:hypothetical protein
MHILGSPIALPLSALPEGMENALAKQREACSPIPHPFDQLQLVDMALEDSIVLGEGQNLFI